MKKDETLPGDHAARDALLHPADGSKQDSETAIDQIDRINRIVFQRILDRRAAKSVSQPDSK